MEKEYSIPLYGFIFLFFTAPLLQGFYTEPYLFLGVLIPIAVLAYSTFLLNPGKDFKLQPVDVLVLILFFAYLISTFNAGDRHEAIVTDLKLAGYLALYFWFRIYNPPAAFAEYMGITIYMSAIAVSLITWLGAFGVVEIEHLITGNIFQTTFGYKNTGALFLALGLYLGLWLFIEHTQKINRILVVAGSALIFMTFIGTQSRAVWIIFVIVLLVALLMFRKDVYAQVIYSGSVVVPPVLGGSLAFKQEPPLSLFIIIISIASAVVFYILADKVTRLLPERGKLVLVGGATVFLIGLVFIKMLPDSPLGRLSTVSLKDGSLMERLYFMKDAWKIISDHLWFGTGGQGWDAYYLNYQSYAYYTENVHNTYLQTWLEAGIFGFIAFLTIWLSIFFYTVKIKKTETFLKVVILFLWTLGLHSLIDFDLTYGAISLLFWLVTALLVNAVQGTAEYSDKKKYKKKVPGPYRFGIVVIYFLLIVFTGILTVARIYYDQSKILLAGGAVQESAAALEKSLGLDPYNINTLVRLSQLNLQLSDLNPGYLERSIFYGKEAIRVKPSEPMGHYVLAEAYLKADEIDLGVYELEQYVKYHPNLIKAYENLAEGYVLAAKRHLSAGDKPKASQYLLKVQTLVENVKQKKRRYPPDVFSVWKDEPVLDVSQNIINTLQEAKNLLK